MSASDDGAIRPARIISVDAFEGGSDRQAQAPYLAVGTRSGGGDTLRNDGGTLIDTRGRNRILSFDTGTGILRCEAGVLLSTIAEKVGFHHFFLPVTPGSGRVTLGGAVAANIVGRNHVARGGLGDHVRSLVLMRGSGEVLTCSRLDNPALFAATLGGFGLTGLILSIELQLMKVPSPHLQRHVIRFDTLAEGLALIEQRIDSHDYVHAWIDAAASGRRAGRGILIAADHADSSASVDLPDLPRKRRYRVPAYQPFNLLADIFVRAGGLGAALLASRREKVSTVPWWQFFWPLDQLGNVEGLAGHHGICSWHCTLPAAATATGVADLLDEARTQRQRPVYSELTRLGTMGAEGRMPADGQGHRLSLLFVDRGSATTQMFAQMARLVTAVGGVIGVQDSRNQPPGQAEDAFFGNSALESGKDPDFSSDFWKNNAVAGTNAAKFGV